MVTVFPVVPMADAAPLAVSTIGRPVWSRELKSAAVRVIEPWVTLAVMVMTPIVLCSGFPPLAGAVLTWSGPRAVTSAVVPSARCAVTGGMG